jgi:serine/threonine protein kinase
MSSNIEGPGPSQVNYSIQSDSSEEIVDDGVDSKLKDIQSDKKSLQSSKGSSSPVKGRIVTNQQDSNSLLGSVYKKALGKSTSSLTRMGSFSEGETDTEAISRENSPLPQLINSAKKTHSLGVVTVVSKVSGKEANMKVIKKVGEGSYSEAFLVKMGNIGKVFGKKNYVIMRPKISSNQEKLKAHAKEARHSGAVLSFLNRDKPVEGIQQSSGKVVQMTHFVSENRATETLGTFQEGELLPYYNGGDLHDSIYGDVSITKEQRVSVVNQLLTGSYHMMLQGVSHGDIKPENVFLSENPEESGEIQACHGDWGRSAAFNEALGRDSFSEVLNSGDYKGPALTPGYFVSTERKVTKSLVNAENAVSNLAEIAGREMMRDHFALGQTLLEVFSTDPNIPLFENIDGTQQTCGSAFKENIILGYMENLLEGKENLHKALGEGLNGLVGKEKPSKEDLKGILNLISSYCDQKNIGKPEFIQEARNLLNKLEKGSSEEEKNEAMFMIEGAAVDFLGEEDSELQESRIELNETKELMAGKCQLALEVVCSHYPQQADLIRGLAGMSSENIADRTSIKGVIRSAIPEDQVREIENRDGANTQLLDDRLALART